MYEEFYGLKEKPFNLTPDPRFFYLSENHREAFEHLLYGIREKEGFILITGDVGTGKTTLCRALLNKLDVAQTETALILNPMVSETDLLQTILQDFGVSTRKGSKKDTGSKKELLDNLNAFLLEKQAAEKSCVLIVDEAQNLTIPVLEEVRILSNLETEKEKLLQIILVGQIELRDKLALPPLRQLNQRISIRYHLKALGKHEVPCYIQHRLAVAGSSGKVNFTSGALREIWAYSRGIPRLINLAADRALLAAYAEQSRLIERQLVLRGLKSLGGEGSYAMSRFTARGRALVAAGIVGIALVLGIAGIVFWRGGFLPSGVLASRPAQPKVAAQKPRKGSFYTLQLGSYATEAQALGVARKVKAQGYPLFLRQVEDSAPGRYLLYAGKFAKRSEAEEVRKIFKQLGDFFDVRTVLTSARDNSKSVP